MQDSIVNALELPPQREGSILVCFHIQELSDFHHDKDTDDSILIWIYMNIYD